MLRFGHNISPGCRVVCPKRAEWTLSTGPMLFHSFCNNLNSEAVLGNILPVCQRPEFFKQRVFLARFSFFCSSCSLKVLVLFPSAVLRSIKFMHYFVTLVVKSSSTPIGNKPFQSGRLLFVPYFVVQRPDFPEDAVYPAKIGFVGLPFNTSASCILEKLE